MSGWLRLACGIAGCLAVTAAASGSGWAADGKEKEPNAVRGDQVVEWLSKGDERKRLMALEALRWDTPHDAAYTAALKLFVGKISSRRVITPSQFQAIGVLAGSPLPDADSTLVSLLTSPDVRLQITAVDALGQRGTESAAAPLMACWNAPLAVEEYGLRHAIVCALGSLKGTAGLDALIGLLPKLDGQLEYEAVARLTLRTGEKFGDQADDWQTWKRTRDPLWAGPAASDQPPPLELAWNTKLPRFFRVPIYARRVLFVVDMSGSMKSTVEGKSRLEATQEELTNAIKALPEESLFGVIAFNDQVKPWQLQPRFATAENKAEAIQAVWSLSAQGKTAVNDALELALSYQGYLEQILVLTDGRPTAGRLVDTAAIVNNISGRNQFRRVRIDTIGLDTTGEAERLLQQLAARNHGRYSKLR